MNELHEAVETEQEHALPCIDLCIIAIFSLPNKFSQLSILSAGRQQ